MSRPNAFPCACTHEAGDSDCAEHPTCNHCGKHLEITRLWAHANVLSGDLATAQRERDEARAECERLRGERDAYRADAENLHREGGPARRELRLLKVEHAKATSDRDRLRALLREAVEIARDERWTSRPPEVRMAQLARLAALASEGGV